MFRGLFNARYFNDFIYIYFIDDIISDIINIVLRFVKMF